MTNYMTTSGLMKSATPNKHSLQFIKRIHFSQTQRHIVLLSVSSNNAVISHLISKVALARKQILSINCKY